MGEIHENPYQYDLEPGSQLQSEGESDQNSSSESNDSVDEEFETINSWHIH